MIITLSFEVKNHVEVMEGWPIRIGDTTFHLERDGTLLRRVSLSFAGVSTDYAPKVAQSKQPGGSSSIKVSDGDYANRARKKLLQWQAVITGAQIIDLAYDNPEIRYHAENVEEEEHIHLKSIKTSYDESLNLACDFEQFGRAFCVETVSDEVIESTAHYREGRLAFEAGRYVDAYNNMFLFLETRYCDGKTKTAQQIQLLAGVSELCTSIEETARAFLTARRRARDENFDLFSVTDSIEAKVRALVLLRGRLRHHSLKSPHRWDPNRQGAHKGEARFLCAVVQELVMKETFAEIYAPEPLELFRNLSIASGNETKIEVATTRTKPERALQLNMSYPTTVISSLLCVNTIRQALTACEEAGQIADTVKLRARHVALDVELFTTDLGVWAYTTKQEIELKESIQAIQCDFEQTRGDLVTKHGFAVPYRRGKITILDTWKLFSICFDHIEDKQPTTRIMSLRLSIPGDRREIAAYRTGAMVRS
ncbi:hypothetical protein [Jannaschia sp. 2305UL9-9]|uniref:hypothetical protein n=1 Tax=Jannaschia sp. 2305UL9-9 TaxID=3121638 RepID=UPI003528370A